MTMSGILGEVPSSSGRWKFAHHLCVEAVYRAFTSERDELHFTRLSRLEANGGARRDVQAEAASYGAVELQRRIYLEEVVVRAYLNGTIAGVAHDHGHRLTVDVQFKFARHGHHLPWHVV